MGTLVYSLFTLSATIRHGLLSVDTCRPSFFPSARMVNAKRTLWEGLRALLAHGGGGSAWQFRPAEPPFGQCFLAEPSSAEASQFPMSYRLGQDWWWQLVQCVLFTWSPSAGDIAGGLWYEGER